MDVSNILNFVSVGLVPEGRCSQRGGSGAGGCPGPSAQALGDAHLVVVGGLLAHQVQDVGCQVLENASEEDKCA